MLVEICFRVDIIASLSNQPHKRCNSIIQFCLARIQGERATDVMNTYAMKYYVAVGPKKKLCNSDFSDVVCEDELPLHSNISKLHDCTEYI